MAKMEKSRVSFFGLDSLSGALYDVIPRAQWMIVRDTNTLNDYVRICEDSRDGYVVVHLTLSASDRQIQAQVGQIMRGQMARILLAGTSEESYNLAQKNSVAFLESRGFRSVSREDGHFVASVLAFLGI